MQWRGRRVGVGAAGSARGESAGGVCPVHAGPHRMTDRRVSKHYLSATSFADGKTGMKKCLLEQWSLLKRLQRCVLRRYGSVLVHRETSWTDGIIITSAMALISAHPVNAIISSDFHTDTCSWGKSWVTDNLRQHMTHLSLPSVQLSITRQIRAWFN